MQEGGPETASWKKQQLRWGERVVRKMLHGGKSLPLSTSASTEAQMGDSDRGHQERHFPEPFAFRRSLEAAGFSLAEKRARLLWQRQEPRCTVPVRGKRRPLCRMGTHLCGSRWAKRCGWAGPPGLDAAGPRKSCLR